MKKCMGCMRDYSDDNTICPACGYSASLRDAAIQELPDAIRPETILSGRFIMGKVMSDSPYSYVYIAWDALLQRRVAVKEYFPERYCSREPGEREVRFHSLQEQTLFEKGRSAFEKEALLLNASQDLPGIVSVYRCVNENQTSYLVMEYLEGISLQDHIEWGEPLPMPAETIIRQIMDIVESMHDRGIMHLNLSPDNIYLETGGRIRLLDFGNAKRKIYQLSRKPMPIYQDGFIAPEILNREKAGTGADLYSIGAVYYYLLTGKEPSDSMRKLRRNRLSTGDPEKDRLIHILMEPQVKMRPDSITQLRKLSSLI